jgi:hypothetical protein
MVEIMNVESSDSIENVKSLKLNYFKNQKV